MSGLPLLWPDAERSKVLAGSHLDECVGSAKAGLLAQWAQIEQVLPSVDGNECPPEVFNAAGYLWAHAIVLTRALPFGETLSLIPFLDLANHIAGSPNTCSIGVAGKGTAVMDKLQLESLGGEGAAVLTAGQSVAEGEQIFIDYGESGWRSSWEMLYTYGFVPGSEPQDFMAAGGRPVFFEGISPTDPLMPQKQALLVALGADESAGEGVWVDLQVNGAQSAAMAPLLRLKHLAEGAESMDEAGRAMVTNLAAWQADPTLLWTSLQKPVGAAIEAKVAHQVLEACEAALSTLPTVEELAPAAGPPAQEADAESDATREAERGRLAARVLLGERSALEACVATWQRAAKAAKETDVSI